MSIQLPKYSSLVENSVFSRDIFKDLEGNGRKIMLKQILILKRYKEQTEDDVVRYLQTKVEELEGISSLILPNGVNIGNKSPLEEAIIKLNPSVLRDIKNGKEDCLNFIRQATKAIKLRDGATPSQYLYVKYGLIPHELKIENRDTENSRFYSNLLTYLLKQSRGILGESFKMSLLTNEWVLPERSDLEVLLKHMTNSSKTFEIDRYKYNIEEVRSILDAVYSGLNKDGILKLEDISREFLEDYAEQPVIALHQMSSINQIVQEQKKNKGLSIN